MGERREQRGLLKAGKWANILTFVVFTSILSFVSHADDPDFGNQTDLGLIEHAPINEASGIAASRGNPDVLWTHNDSGDSPRVFAFNTQGEHLGVYSIVGVSIRDWEDMAVGPGPVDSQQYLYIGEIGDNSAQYDLKYIYRVPEPAVDPKQAPVNTTINGVERIAFRYPDGRRDAETLMVDPLTKDIYIISKREANVGVYRAPYPQSTTDPIILEHVATLSLNQVVAGDISPSGFEILITTYTTVYCWRRTSEQNLWEVFTKKPETLPYSEEPQGEAICWKADSMGYYTISEERGGTPAHLYLYPRFDAPPVNVQATTWGEIKSK